MNYLLETEKLTKQYGSQKAVNEVSLHLEKGAIYGFIGRNGAGKTTFLKMICGMAKPTSGSITLFGKKDSERASVMPKVGALIEAPGIYPGMTAYDNLKLKCRAAGINKNGYIEDILKTIGLEKVGRKKAGCFSLGMKQRLGIAQAVLNDPKIQDWIYGAKGVGSHGDGTVQLLARDKASQQALVDYLNNERHMEAFAFKLNAGGKVKKAIIPIAGMGTRMFPETFFIKKAFLP